MRERLLSVRRLATRRRMVVALVSVVALVVALYAPSVVWNLRPETSLEVLLVDKTVTRDDYREHAGAVWALNHARVIDPTLQRPFNASKDYAGTVLLADKEKVTSRPIPERTGALDMVYLADTYGVYQDDLSIRALQGEFSPALTEALTLEDLDLLERNLRPGGTLVAEFNTMASPTRQAAARRLGNLVGVSATGWSGRHFGSLDAEQAGTSDSDLPVWAPRLWETQEGTPWEFTGSGWVLVGPGARVVVLQEEPSDGDAPDVTAAGMQVVFPDSTRELVPGLARELTYDYWFDIVEPLPGAEVLGSYEFRVTSEGATELEEAGVPSSFPAAVRYVRPDGGPSYYLAGDWADQMLGRNGDVGPYQWAGITWWNRLAVPEGRDEQKAFYWNVYQPLMQALIQENLASS